MLENLPIKVGMYTARLYRLMASSLDKALKDNGIPISLEQFKIMMMLHNCGERSLADIAKIIDRDNAAFTRSVKSLEEKGFVKRETKTEDKRYKNLIITSIGADALESMIAIEQANARKVLENFTESESKQFEFLLDKASLNLLNPNKTE